MKVDQSVGTTDRMSDRNVEVAMERGLETKPRASRGSGRGTVLVESLIVIGMITIFLAVAIMLHGVYIQKLVAMREARAEAMMLGLRGCRGGLLSAAGLPVLIESIVSLENAPVQETSPWFSIGAEKSARSRTASAPSLIGGQAYALNSESRVACNEEVQPYADLGAVFSWGFNQLVPDF